jgi:4-aminobutyrate aminotransferase/(S)-3-amino-2-methylpropionate transaminase
MTTNAQLWSRRVAAVAPGVGSMHQIFADRALNSEVWDVEGRRYIDFAGGIAVVNTGHCHPHVLQAVESQLKRFTHTCFQVLPYDSYVELAEKLNAIVPGKTPKKTLFLTTGAEALENTIKIARAATGRPGVIAFNGGYHGRTMMTLAMTGKVDPYKLGFGPFPSDIYHVPFPTTLHGVSVDDSMNAIEKLFKSDIEARRVAAIVIELVQGEGGFYVAPPDLLQRLRALCDEHGILLVVDEVQTGFGRTGKMFALEHYQVEADLVALAKSLAGGFPVSAVVGKASVMDTVAAGGLGGTYGGSPVGCAAALAVIEVFENENLLVRATEIGARIRKRLVALADKHSEIGEVRGLGPMLAIELFKDDKHEVPAPESAKALVTEAAKRGLILLSCGTFGNVVRILVPLTVQDKVLDEGMKHFEAALAAVAQKR